MRKVLLLALILANIAFAGFSQNIPSSFSSQTVLRDFISRNPQFKSETSGIIVTLSYSASGGFVMYADGNNIGHFETDLNPRYPTRALLGLQWNPGWGPAPFVLDVAGGEPFLALLPVEGQENIYMDDSGQIKPGRSWKKNWMSLDVRKNGIVFTPMDRKPSQSNFNFIGFKK